MDKVHNEVLDEVVALHRFISAWFRGEEANTREVFDAGFSARFDADFLNIQPAGRILSRDALLRAVQNGHGSNPAFEIEIDELRVRRVFDKGRLIVATYREVQDGARNSHPPRNARVSTVLFSREYPDGRLLWLHLHETKSGLS
jgi:hypothetical protein